MHKVGANRTCTAVASVDLKFPKISTLKLGSSFRYAFVFFFLPWRASAKLRNDRGQSERYFFFICSSLCSSSIKKKEKKQTLVSSHGENPRGRKDRASSYDFVRWVFFQPLFGTCSFYCELAVRTSNKTKTTDHLTRSLGKFGEHVANLRLASANEKKRTKR